MAEEEADASYSDGEFGSERADSEDYEEFEQDEDAVHGSFDQEPKEEVAAEEVAAETEVEDYDGDFDEDEAVQKEKTASKQSSEASTGTSQDSALSVEASFNSDVLVVAPDQSDEIRNSAAETVQDEAVEPSVVAHKAQEKAISRRASLPAGMSEDPPPRKPFLHSGSMPTIRLERPLDKWMDTIPKELSPEKPGRIKIARLPVLQEPNSDDDGETNVDNAGNCDDDDSDDACAARQVHTRTRAQSYRDLREKEVVPIRRSRSLLCTGPLPTVKEIPVTEMTVNKVPGQDDQSYAEDDDFGNDIDTGQTPDSERLQKPAPVSPSQSVDDRTASGVLPNAEAIVTSSPDTSSTDGAREPVYKELNAAPQQEDEDDYADEMEDDFPSDFNTPQFEVGGTPHKSNEDIRNFDVEEIIDEGRRGTDTLLEQVRSFLQEVPDDSRDRVSCTDQDVSPRADPPGQAEKRNDEVSALADANVGPHADAGGENVASPYDDDDEFAADDDVLQGGDIAEDNPASDHDCAGQYTFDGDEDEFHEPADLPIAEQSAPSDVVQPALSDADPSESPRFENVSAIPLQFVNGTTQAEQDVMETKIEDPVPPQSKGLIVGDPLSKPVETEAAPVKPVVEGSTVKSTARKEKKAPVQEHPPKPTRPEQTQAASRPVRHRALKAVTPPTQPPPPKPWRPATNKVVPSSSSTGTRHNTSPSHSAARATLTENSPGEAIKTNLPLKSLTPRSVPRKLDSPPKAGLKASSPRSSSKPSFDPHEHLPSEYSRKEPVPKQKPTSKHCTNGEHKTKRQPLQPVRTPAKLRFDLPNMEKSKRDWLFANMFRHGDDTSKYEAFVSPALFARRPSSSSAKVTKKRPLSARQVYGDPQTSMLAASNRKPVQQPWVDTSLRDSKLPQYDSILDKFCTTVTSPMVQRQIYQTRHRDLSPQLAFVLEKRVERQYRKGFYDSFGAVSSSYNTEIVPDGNRVRQISPRAQTSSGMLPQQ